MDKVLQQQLILLIALYILRKNEIPKPNKRQVLNFIRLKNLMNIPEQDLSKRWISDHDSIWQNDIAWKRKNLYENGLIESPEWGRWRISSLGILKVDSRKSDWRIYFDPEERRRLLADFPYLTDSLVSWMVRIANNESLALGLSSPAQVG